MVTNINKDQVVSKEIFINILIVVFVTQTSTILS